MIVVSGGRPNYMYQAAEAVGARLVHVGSAERVTPADFAAAIGPRTAAVLLIVATLDHQRARSAAVTATVETVAAVTRAAGVPLVVDAAAELPPADNLRAFLRQGADLVIFSGGKGIRGPQVSGLVLGRGDLVAAAAANNNPHSAIGRPLKVGKEEIAGLVRAVELFVARDEAAELAAWRAMAEHVAAALADLPGVRCTVGPDGRYCRPPVVPICLVHLDPTAGRPTPAEAAQRLFDGEPSIGVGRFDGGLVVNPIALAAGQERVVADSLRRLLSSYEQDSCQTCHSSVLN